MARAARSATRCRGRCSGACVRRAARRRGGSARIGSGNTRRGRGGPRCTGSAALEIGRVPTRSFELEPRCGQLFAKAGRPACGAITQRCIRHFLKHILAQAARPALVRVNRHEGSQFKNGKKPRIINLERLSVWLGGESWSKLLARPGSPQ
jgi:hypothetical protein